MTMRQVAAPAVPSPRRVGIAEAKSKLSEVLRDSAKGPTIIHNRGRDLAVLLTIEAYEHLLAEHPGGPGSGNGFLGRVELVKRRHGGGVDDFAPARTSFDPVDPFARRRAPRR